MKKRHTIIISCVLAVGIILSGLAFADSQGKGDRQGFGSKRHHKGAGLMLLTNYQQKNLMVQVLSELTGESTEAISAKLKEKRMRTVMHELGIDRQAFRAKMRTKVSEQVNKAVANGTITAEQEKEILEKMGTRAQRREIMSRLVEKGVADGTITQEEAQMLIRRPR